MFNGRRYLLEEALPVDWALVRVRRADPFGNGRFWRTSRNFSDAMAMAARTTVLEAEELVDLGAFDPDTKEAAARCLTAVAGAGETQARSVLDDGSGEPFFVMNADVVCDYPLKDMIAAHKVKQAEATILVTKVADPSAFGVVVMDGQQCVERFVEKPKEFVGDKINAGIYLVSPAILNRIEMRPTSIERETFPAIAADKKLFAFTLQVRPEEKTNPPRTRKMNLLPS